MPDESQPAEYKRTTMLGWSADKVLRMRGPGIRSQKMGVDRFKNWIVKWYYPERTLTMGYRTGEGISCYRVIKDEPTT